MCLIVSALSLILFALVAALVLLNTSDPTRTVFTASLATLIVSALFGGIFTARVYNEKELKVPLINSGIIALLMLVASLMLNGGVDGRALLNCALYLLSFNLSSFLTRPRGRRRKR